MVNAAAGSLADGGERLLWLRADTPARRTTQQ